MVKNIFVTMTFFVTGLLAREWVETGTSRPAEPVWVVNTISDNQLEISFDLGGYFVEDLANGKNKITFPGGVPNLEVGTPDLPKMAQSIIIPDLAHMELSIVESKFVEFFMENLISSKGNLTRNINPASVPYTFGQAYETDEFYPQDIVFMRNPYIMRTVRGQAIVFQPIQYNPIQRTLRVYTHIKVNIQQNGMSQINPLTRRPAKGGSREFENIYAEHFLNYSTNSRYELLGEEGPMLVVCYGEFMESMQPFVEWKNYKGIPTEMVDVADIGGSDEIEAFVETKYYDDGIAFVLFVGDIDQIPSPRYSDGAGSNSPADPSYGFVAGSDYYPEIIIGRFSAEDTSHVETMINRTIEYEMDPDPTADWYKKGSGFASDQGPGDDGELDYEHLDNIRDDLLGFTYVEVDQIYDPSGTVEDGEVALNEGRSIVNYTGHGSNGSWGNGCPLNQTDVNGLVNMGMYPFIWSVACVNGEFHIGTCFAETWLRATGTNGVPTGAIAVLMSTVNQSWSPPMDGQDEMNDILVESYENNIKRTYGGLSMNGVMHMADSYGTAGEEEILYWTIFGDPSVVVRTDTPTDMTVSHNDVMIIGAEEFSIETGMAAALVAVSRDGELLASTYTDATGGTTLEFETPLEIPGPVDLVVTAFNKMPYETTVNVIAPDGAYMLMGDIAVTGGADQILDYGETGSLYITFENVGQDLSEDLTITLIHEAGMVTLNSNVIQNGSIAAGTEVTIGPFEFQVSWNVDDGGLIPFVIQATDNIETWEYEINIPVEAPDYNLISVDFLDLGNGTLDPGETTTMQLVLTNVGHSPVSSPTFEVTTRDPNIILGAVESDNAYWWEIDSQVTITIEVTAVDDAPVGHTALLGIIIGSGGTNYENVFPLTITLGLLIEDFESGSFTSFDWIQGGDAEWTIDSVSYSGNYSAKSGTISHNQTSELSIELNILNEGQTSFWAKTSSEQSGTGNIYDYLEFYIDDEAADLNIGGELDWTEYTVDIPVGEHSLRWVYQKDGAQSLGQDCAWLDRIVFPTGSILPLNIDFGDANLDGSISILDVILSVNYVIGHIDFSIEQSQNADMNLDGIVNIYDVFIIVDMVMAN
ncbi:MAG: hypothetical protein HOM19_08925 [Candidatus Marinimicrobia bacterium]|jgi:hypothetical protein|nr:hypothetical protein [Candidatus Neomarinimicrobiota bacterium]